MSQPSSCNQLSPSTIVGTSPPDWSMVTPQDQESLRCFSTLDLVSLYTPEKWVTALDALFELAMRKLRSVWGL